MKQTLFFKECGRVYTGNTYSYSKFQDNYRFILLEHATDLFTPAELLKDIKNKLRTHTSLVYLTGEQILSYLDDCQRSKFEKYYGKKYQIYILYCNPLTEINNFTWRGSQSIYNFFKQNPNCPAARFYDNTISIIVLNSNIIPLTDNGKQLQLQLDHELNHIFDKLADRQYPDINHKVQQQIIKYFKDLDILQCEVQSDDFSIHMFNSSEFYEMLANLCNVISLYFQQSDNIKLFQKLINMLTDQYLKSDQFKQLREPIQGALIFAYICRKYSPDRWNRTIKAVKHQLQIDDFKHSIQLLIFNLKNNLKRIIKNFK